ncbi:hypothetical protein SODALDRAFT_357904 [Sodiomyces alkalinus F11]|uniref:Uncharacterized protein n=1 Tax=Sodiomyces alkalinus (strain CBS 110278 / VKM F-3762 / F11) TaxID=1314773 RepID=A0A3N2PYE3_SODAK|nr:hypothetical protein SODALDRAFT_357904 [Sodiomyces alkalinus F11]ROT39502.1 hypothetical protein SODALDRAFT_357904 [Sodiomyces alkalinus F11]
MVTQRLGLQIFPSSHHFLGAGQTRPALFTGLSAPSIPDDSPDKTISNGKMSSSFLSPMEFDVTRSAALDDVLPTRLFSKKSVPTSSALLLNSERCRQLGTSSALNPVASSGSRVGDLTFLTLEIVFRRLVTPPLFLHATCQNLGFFLGKRGGEDEQQERLSASTNVPRVPTPRGRWDAGTLGRWDAGTHDAPLNGAATIQMNSRLHLRLGLKGPQRYQVQSANRGSGNWSGGNVQHGLELVLIKMACLHRGSAQRARLRSGLLEQQTLLKFS